MKRLFVALIIMLGYTLPYSQSCTADTVLILKGLRARTVDVDTFFARNSNGARYRMLNFYAADNNASLYLGGSGVVGLTTGNNNGCGHLSLANIKNGTDGNAAYGGYAMHRDSTGEKNSAFGISAMELLSSGHRNWAGGYCALYSNMHYHDNAASGYLSMSGGFPWRDHAPAVISQSTADGSMSACSATVIRGSEFYGYMAASTPDTIDTCMFFGIGAGSHPLQKTSPKHQIAFGEGVYLTTDSTAQLVPSFYNSTTLGGRYLYTGTLSLADSASAPTNTGTPARWIRVRLRINGTYVEGRIPFHQ